MNKRYQPTSYVFVSNVIYSDPDDFLPEARVPSDGRPPIPAGRSEEQHI